MDNTVLAPLMFLHRFFSVELLMANMAFKRSIISMSSFVDPEISLLSVLFAADFAGKWLLSGMCHQMSLHSCNADKPLLTNCAYRQDLGRSFSYA
jgi:hypothetical protein